MINGKDRTAALESHIRHSLRSRDTSRVPDTIAWEISALSLGEVDSESDYEDRLIQLIPYRDHVHTLPFDIPHRGGLLGRCTAVMKRFLWKLLRYQHDQMAFRQNLINSMHTSATEFERSQLRTEIGRLEERIEKLERKGEE